MKVGPKSSLRPFLHRALQLLTKQEKLRVQIQGLTSENGWTKLKTCKPNK